MIDLATLLPGQSVWTKGKGPFGDSRLGGCVFRSDDNPDTGERFVWIITDSAMTPRQDFLYLHRSKGGYDSLGLVARLERVPVNDIDPHATDGFLDYRTVWRWAIAALRAASLPPNHIIGTRSHDELITCYRTLRPIAEMLKRDPGWKP